MKIFEIKLDKHVFKETPEGYLVAEANLTRTGVFQYPEYNTKELRHPNEVFKKDSLDTLKLKPITFYHPSEMVDSKNYSKYEIGVIGENIKIDGDFITATILIKDKNVIDYIKNKYNNNENVELSCGYKADTVKEYGIYRDEEYTHKQTNIVYNHISIVEKGRAGKDVKIKLDAISEVKMSKEITEINAKLDSVIKESDVLKEKLNTKEEELKNLNSKLDSIQAEGDILRKENDDLKSKLDVKSDFIKNIIANAKKMDSLKTKYNIEDEDISMIELKKKIIIKLDSKVKLDGKSNDYIDAYFDFISKKEYKTDQYAPLKEAVKQFNEVKNDKCGNEEKKKDSKAEYIKKLENRYKGEK